MGLKQCNVIFRKQTSDRVCLFSQKEKTILVLQNRLRNVQFEFRQGLHHYILLALRTSTVASASKKVTMSTIIIISFYHLLYLGTVQNKRRAKTTRSYRESIA